MLSSHRLSTTPTSSRIHNISPPFLDSIHSPARGSLDKERSIEPDRRWKEHLRRRLEGQYVGDAILIESLSNHHKSTKPRMAQNPANSPSPNYSHDKIMQRANAEYELELERERNKRKRILGASKLNSSGDKHTQEGLTRVSWKEELKRQEKHDLRHDLMKPTKNTKSGTSTNTKTSEHRENKRSIQNNVNPEATLASSSERTIDKAECMSQEDLIQALLTQTFNVKDSYKAFLSLGMGPRAQRTMDALYKILKCPGLVEDRLARRTIFTASMRLAGVTGLYPRQLKLTDIQPESSAVTAGQFGEIWKGNYKGQSVCLKVSKFYQQSQIEKLVKNFYREAILWSQFSHPNLLPFYGIYHFGDSIGRLCLVSPWISNGNVSEYIKRRPHVARLPLIYDIIAGLHYLHDHQYVHGDLKGLNILIDSNGSARLADFGLSSAIDTDILKWTSFETMSGVGGTVRWSAPELIEDVEQGGAYRVTRESDIYSLASVMYEVFTGCIPYYEYLRDVTVISRVIRGFRPSRPSTQLAPELSEMIWGTMESCWSATPSERPTIENLMTFIADEDSLASLLCRTSESTDCGEKGVLPEADRAVLMELVNMTSSSKTA